MLLIVSTAEDVHAQSVRRVLGEERCLIWDPDWDDKLSLSIRIGDNESFLGSARTGKCEIELTQVDAVWYRRPISAMPRILFRTEAYFVARERGDALEAFFVALRTNQIPVYNMPSANYLSTAKPIQYKMAKESGLRIPDTLISNDPEAVLDFMAGHSRAILKGVSLSGLETEDKHYAVFVHEIDEYMLDGVREQLPRCPVTVQELIDWSYAARILVIDEKAWCFTTPRGDHLDWRVDFDAKWRLSPLPRDVHESLMRLHGSLNLRYGCVDMLIDDLGCWWFLETNANGQWLWLEESSGFPLSRDVGAAFLSH